MGKMPSCHPLGPLLRLEGLDYAALPPEDTRQKTNPSGWTSKGKQIYKGESQIGGPGKVVVDLLERSILKSELKTAVELGVVAPPEDGDAASASHPGVNNAPLRDSTKTPTPETWACRRSLHENEAAAGTASWDEILLLMKDLHVETEKAMTPTVPKAQSVFEWRAVDRVGALEVPGFEDTGPGPWSKFTLKMVEMEHDLGTEFLWHRVFPVLQMTCCTANQAKPPEILIVSIPINGWKGAQLPADVNMAKLADSPKIVVGSYASVERFRMVERAEADDRPVSTLSRLMRSLQMMRRPAATTPAAAVSRAGAPPSASSPLAAAGQGNAAPAQGPMQGPVAGGNDDEIQPAPTAATDGQSQNDANVADSSHINAPEMQIEWTMATASHARGRLPLFIQTPVVPKKIAIDVPLFLKYVQTVRQGGEASGSSDSANQSAGQQSDQQPAVDPPAR
ncbi:MAG: hypothetical protein STHCBS139747_001181 [Sporothrix thermara]